MASLHGRDTYYNFVPPQEETVDADDITRIKKELNLLKNAVWILVSLTNLILIYSQNPFRMAEMALEIQIERLHVTEITKARDAALQRLSDAYVSIRQKTQVIERLQQEREVKGLPRVPVHISPLEERTEIDCLKAHIVGLEATVGDLRFTIQRLQRQLPIGSQSLDPPPCYQEDALKVSLHDYL